MARAAIRVGLAIAFFLAATAAGIGAALLLGSQCLIWLDTAQWPPRPISHFVATDWINSAFKGAGSRQIATYVAGIWAGYWLAGAGVIFAVIAKAILDDEN